MGGIENSIAVIKNKFDTMCNASDEIEKAQHNLRVASEQINNEQRYVIENTLTCRQKCEELGISEPTLIRRRNSGLIPFVKLGKCFYYLKSAKKGAIHG